MRIHRSKRIAQTLAILHRSSVVTAQSIARELKVSERTVYRYIQVLLEMGYRIEGEAGVGYRLRIRHDPMTEPDDRSSDTHREERI